MDRVAAAAKTAESAARAPGANDAASAGITSRELISRLALAALPGQARHQGRLRAVRAIEVALLVEPALRPAASDARAFDAWCRQLFDMYRAWSDNRHMQVSELPNGTPSGLPLLLVSGFGAHRVLARECGLHVLELAESGNGANRVTARVRLAVAPLGDVPPAQNAAPRSSRRSTRRRARTRSCAATAASPRRWCAAPTAAGAPAGSTPCCAAISISWRPRRRSGGRRRSRVHELRPRAGCRPLAGRG